MRIIVAEMSHETNTFSPVVTDLARFSHGASVPQEGDGAIATFRGTATVRSWLYRIAINCALSWLRDHRREQPTELAEDALTASNPAPAKLAADDDHARLRRAIEQLPPKQKLVLELRVFDDLSFKEVAELADCTENTAKVNFHYAVKRLRDILGGEHAP